MHHVVRRYLMQLVLQLSTVRIGYRVNHDIYAVEHVPIAAVGQYLLEQLKELSTHPTVGDVRGIGLFCTVEFVKDKETKEPFDDALTAKLKGKLVAKGLLSRTRNSSTSFLPPLVFTKSDADEAVAILDRSITEVEKELLK